MDISEKIDRLIRNSLIAKSHVAKRAGISRGGLESIINGKSSPSINTLEKILNVLDIRLFEFFSDEDLKLTQESLMEDKIESIFNHIYETVTYSDYKDDEWVEIVIILSNMILMGIVDEKDLPMHPWYLIYYKLEEDIVKNFPKDFKKQLADFYNEVDNWAKTQIKGFNKIEGKTIGQIVSKESLDILQEYIKFKDQVNQGQVNIPQSLGKKYMDTRVLFERYLHSSLQMIIDSREKVEQMDKKLDFFSPSEEYVNFNPSFREIVLEHFMEMKIPGFERDEIRL